MLTHLLSPQFPQLLHSQDDLEYGFPIYRVFSSPRSETNIENHRINGWNREFLNSKQFFQHQDVTLSKSYNLEIVIFNSIKVLSFSFHGRTSYVEQLHFLGCYLFKSSSLNHFMAETCYVEQLNLVLK